jgi:hypothetical protein
MFRQISQFFTESGKSLTERHVYTISYFVLPLKDSPRLLRVSCIKFKYLPQTYFASLLVSLKHYELALLSKDIRLKLWIPVALVASSLPSVVEHVFP